MSQKVSEGLRFSGSAPLAGGFRTPSLRNLQKSAWYGHNGAFVTVEELVDFHAQAGGHAENDYVGCVDPLRESHAPSDENRAALLGFVNAEP